MLSSLTPEFFDAAIILVMVIGLVLAGLRFYRDMTRPTPTLPVRSTRFAGPTMPEALITGDTQPNPALKDD